MLKRSLIPVRLGALLTSANIVRPEALAQALQTARLTGDRIGEILSRENHVSERDLDSAIQIHKMIREGGLPVGMGVQALRVAHARKCPVRVALRTVGWEDSKSIRINDLAQLLLDAGCITKPQLEQASWNCAKNGLPLGRNLVLTGAISPSILSAALNALVLVRDGRTSTNAAGLALRASIVQHTSIEEALGLPAWVSAHHVRVGELLSLSGILSESDATTAVETGLLSQRPIGEVLLELRMVPAFVLDATLKLQKLVADGQLGKVQAAELLKQVINTGTDISQYLQEMSVAKDRALGLLTASGVVTVQQIDHSKDLFGQLVNDPVRALMSAGYLTPEVFRKALRFVFMIDEGSLDEESAISHLYGTLAQNKVAHTPSVVHDEIYSEQPATNKRYRASA
jgi:hypothetical protein